MKALIGHTGFIGSNLKNLCHFDHFYNSKNIKDITDFEYDEVICSGTPGVKWKANKFPEEDLEKIKLLQRCLLKSKIKKFTLLSTIDVYANPVNVSESDVKSFGHHPYGNHRSFFEDFILERFESKALRLPIVYGPNFKKNYLYDLMNKNNLSNICLDSEVQLYNACDLPVDIDRSWQLESKVINLASEPVKFSRIVDIFFPDLKDKCTNKKAFKTDMKTLYASSGEYWYDDEAVIKKIGQFLVNESVNI